MKNELEKNINHTSTLLNNIIINKLNSNKNVRLVNFFNELLRGKARETIRFTGKEPIFIYLKTKKH